MVKCVWHGLYFLIFWCLKSCLLLVSIICISWIEYTHLFHQMFKFYFKTVSTTVVAVLIFLLKLLSSKNLNIHGVNLHFIVKLQMLFNKLGRHSQNSTKYIVVFNLRHSTTWKFLHRFLYFVFFPILFHSIFVISQVFK